MTESKKPVSAEDLRKALAEVEAIVWATCESGSLGMEKMNELLHKFSVFQTKLQTLLSDFGDLSEYDNDDVIDLVNGLKELLEATQK